MREFIDLTHPIEPGMLTFGTHWHPPVSVERLGRLDVEGRETRRITLGSHTGTHVDAPLHFIAGGSSVDEVPLGTLIGEVAILDFSRLRPNESVSRAMLENAPLERRVLFRFGWGRHWGDRARYFRDWPFLQPEAAQYLVEQGVRLVGLDTCSPDDSRQPLDGGPGDSPVHKILLGNGVTLVEYLANLHLVEDLGGWTLIALPLRVRGSDGAPARVCLVR